MTDPILQNISKVKSNRSILLGVLILVMSLFNINITLANTGVNAQIPYSGTIVRNDGTGLEGLYKAKFLLYNASSGGTAIYEEIRDGGTSYAGTGVSPALTVSDGRFEILLGSQNTTNFTSILNDDSLWLELQLDMDNNGSYEEIFSPRRRLGSALSAINSMRLVANGGTSTNTLSLDSIGNLVFTGDSATERMRITGAGNVGIGTSSPLGKLTVAANSADQTLGAFTSWGGGFYGGNGTYKTASFFHGYWGASREVASIGFVATSSNAGSGYGYGNIVFGTGSSGNGDSGSTSMERMRITSEGNVGIGTTEPAVRFAVMNPTPWYGNEAAHITEGGVNPQRLRFGTAGSYSWIQSTKTALYQAALVLNGDGGNVGIGTASPSAKLQVLGSGTTSATTALNVTNSAGTSMLFVRDDGNVGIGTSSPESTLTLTRDLSHNGPTIQLRTSGVFAGSGQQIGAVDFHNSDADVPGVAAYVRAYAGPNYGVGGELVFGTQTTWNGHSPGVLAERMRITSEGNVGIGTTSPEQKLHVQGSNLLTTFQNSSTGANQYTQLEFKAGSRLGYIWLGNQNTTNWAGDGGLNIYTATGHMDFWTAATQRMRITSEGNVGIGTTVAPIAGLDLQSTIGTFRQKGYTTVVTDVLGANLTQARRFEIARATIDYNDWNNTGTIEIELHERYYGSGLKKKYNVYYGGVSNYGVYLAEAGGATGTWGGNNFQVTIGNEVTISGDNRYIPIYVDVRYYGQVTAVLRTNRTLTTSNPPGAGEIWVNSAPTESNIADFSADSTVYVNNATSFSSVFNQGNVGIGTSNPGQRLHVSGGIRYVAATANNNTTVCRNSDGDLAGCSSLASRKDNVTDLPLGLNAVMQLRPVSFDWKSYTNAPSTVRRDLGFIAEEVAAISPLLARYNDSTGELEGVRYSQLSSLLTRAIQEQQQLILEQRDKLSLYNTALSLRADGNVGIGTTSPTAKLHLAAGTATANTSPLKFTSGTNLTNTEAGAMEWNGTNLFLTTSGNVRQTINQGLTATDTLDFPSTNNASFSDVTVTVTGAVAGDVVTLGIPNASVPDANSNFTAWVSANNTVTVRFNNNSGVTQDPASGSFKVFVTKF